MRWAFVVIVTVYLVRLVLEHEYWWFAKRLGQLMVTLATLVLPKGQRVSRKAEWLGELDTLADKERAAFGFALGAVSSAVKARAIHIRRTDHRTKLRSRAIPETQGVIGPIQLVIATNYDRFVVDALKGGWTVSRTSGSESVLLTRGDRESIWFRIKDRD
jgi:hypothetical protein